MKYASILTKNPLDQYELIQIECLIAQRFPQFQLIGLSSGLEKEIKEQIFSLFHWQKIPKPRGRITIKVMSQSKIISASEICLPIVIAILSAEYEHIQSFFHQAIVVGKHSLIGEILENNTDETDNLLKIRKNGQKIVIFGSFSQKFRSVRQDKVFFSSIRSVQELLMDKKLRFLENKAEELPICIPKEDLTNPNLVLLALIMRLFKPHMLFFERSEVKKHTFMQFLKRLDELIQQIYNESLSLFMEDCSFRVSKTYSGIYLGLNEEQTHAKHFYLSFRALDVFQDKKRDFLEDFSLRARVLGKQGEVFRLMSYSVLGFFPICICSRIIYQCDCVSKEKRKNLSSLRKALQLSAFLRFGLFELPELVITESMFMSVLKKITTQTLAYSDLELKSLFQDSLSIEAVKIYQYLRNKSELSKDKEQYFYKIYFLIFEFYRSEYKASKIALMGAASFFYSGEFWFEEMIESSRISSN
ncbi:MAG: hypothetical protein M9962_01520 [Oligoflexia bacterium]|nr:hypothetical protein [Oligoflexia bacterium]